jgi:hypothetical protein
MSVSALDDWYCPAPATNMYNTYLANLPNLDSWKPQSPAWPAQLFGYPCFWCVTVGKLLQANRQPHQQPIESLVL